RMITGSSDHAGCRSRLGSSAAICSGSRDSSVSSKAPAPRSSCMPASRSPLQTCATYPLDSKSSTIAGASRPTGATIRIRSPSPSFVVGMLQHPRAVTHEDRRTTQYVLEIIQRSADANAAAGFEQELPNRPLVPAAALLEDRQSRADGSGHFEEPQAQHGVGQIADVQRRVFLEHSMLREDENREHAALIEIGGQLVQLGSEIALPRHRIQIAVQGVDDDELAAAVHGSDDPIRELSRRDFRGIDLLQGSQPLLHVVRQCQPELVGAIEDDPDRLIEAEEMASLATRGELRRVLQRERRLAGTRLP